MENIKQKKFDEKIIKIICIAVFVIILLAQARMGALASLGKIPKDAVSGINGIISQIQVLLSVALVVIVRKKSGFKTAVILCCIDSVYLLIFGVIKSKNMGALPGVVSPLITIVVCYLIHTYSKQAQLAQEQLEQKNQTLMQENTKIAEHGEKLTQMVYYDALTGLCNKKMFFKELEDAIKEENPAFSVVYLNIDDFDSFNKKYNTDMGDIVLSTLGYRFHNFCGESTVVGRLKGDEFAILLKGPKTKESINSYLSDLRSEVCDTIAIKDKLIDFTMSIGVAVFPRDGRNSKEMMDSAEKAIEIAKKNDNGSIAFLS